MGWFVSLLTRAASWRVLKYNLMLHRSYGGRRTAFLLALGSWSFLAPRSLPKPISIPEAIAMAIPSTVQIRVEVSGKRIFADREGPLTSNGSGFVIDSNGLILTNAHVVADMIEGGHVSRTCWGPF